MQFGRDEEQAIIENVIRRTTKCFSRQFYVSGGGSDLGNLANREVEPSKDSLSRMARSVSPDRSWDVIECSSKLPSGDSSGELSPVSNSLGVSHSTGGSLQIADDRSLDSRTSAVFVVGPSG